MILPFHLDRAGSFAARLPVADLSARVPERVTAVTTLGLAVANGSTAFMIPRPVTAVRADETFQRMLRPRAQACDSSWKACHRIGAARWHNTKTTKKARAEL